VAKILNLNMYEQIPNFGCLFGYLRVQKQKMEINKLFFLSSTGAGW